MIRLTELDLSTVVVKKGEIRLLHPLSMPIKSSILEVEHLSGCKCQGSETNQTSSFRVGSCHCESTVDPS